MDVYTRTLRFNHNPLNLFLKTERKKGLRIGYMEAALEGFYLNSIETGMHPQKLSDLLLEKFYCNDTEAVTGLFQFLINEGDRVSYQIMLPYLLSASNIHEFEEIIRKRFFGIDRFVRQGKNLYNFVKYTEERRDPIIWINDLERGIVGFFVKFGGNLFFISPVFFFLNPIKSCRYVCFLVTLKTPHH